MVTINVSDENDETPAFGSATYTVNTNENLPVDSSLGSFTATDDDAGDSITYYITGKYYNIPQAWFVAEESSPRSQNDIKQH